jgi:hypothetical protein
MVIRTLTACLYHKHINSLYNIIRALKQRYSISNVATYTNYTGITIKLTTTHIETRALQLGHKCITQLFTIYLEL